jgi:potassium-transporting ATPase KdpC subunit
VHAQLRPAIVILAIFTLLTGLLYPVALTGLAQVLFPYQANGSLIERGERVIGSELVGQAFDAPGYFWGRPSATSPFPYNPAASEGSNLGPGNPLLEQAVRLRAEALQADSPENAGPIPVDLVTASASGLDPHISIAAALYQVPRVARERGASEAAIRALVEDYIEERQFDYLGEPRVNVLMLNLALDEAYPKQVDTIQ